MNDAPTLFDDETATDHGDPNSADMHVRDLYQRLLLERGEWEKRVRQAADAKAREEALALVRAALSEILDDVAKLAKAVRSGSDLALLIADRMLDRHTGAAPATAGEAAVRKILDTARAEIDVWEARATEYWNRAVRDRDQILQSEDAYRDLVGAGWTPPAWRKALHRRAIEQEGGSFRDDQHC